MKADYLRNREEYDNLQLVDDAKETSKLIRKYTPNDIRIAAIRALNHRAYQGRLFYEGMYVDELEALLMAAVEYSNLFSQQPPEPPNKDRKIEMEL